MRDQSDPHSAQADTPWKAKPISIVIAQTFALTHFEMVDELVSAHLLITGMVQGVGYRWFVMRRAKEYNLKGYVRNLYDGNVEVEVEGAQGLIVDFAEELKIGSHSAHVTNIELNWGEFENKFKGFEIRF